MAAQNRSARHTTGVCCSYIYPTHASPGISVTPQLWINSTVALIKAMKVSLDLSGVLAGIA
jgi:hypothetical protein